MCMRCSFHIWLFNQSYSFFDALSWKCTWHKGNWFETVSVQSNALVTSFGRLFPFAEVWFVTLGGIGLEYFRRWVQSALEWGSGRDIARQKALLSSPKGPKKIINYRAVPLWLSFYCIIQFLVFFSFDPSPMSQRCQVAGRKEQREGVGWGSCFRRTGWNLRRTISVYTSSFWGQIYSHDSASTLWFHWFWINWLKKVFLWLQEVSGPRLSSINKLTPSLAWRRCTFATNSCSQNVWKQLPVTSSWPLLSSFSFVEVCFISMAVLCKGLFNYATCAFVFEKWTGGGGTLNLSPKASPGASPFSRVSWVENWPQVAFPSLFGETMPNSFCWLGMDRIFFLV